MCTRSSGDHAEFPESTPELTGGPEGEAKNLEFPFKSVTRKL